MQKVRHSFGELLVEARPQVSVLFADIVKFSTISCTVSAEVLVQLLNAHFTLLENMTAQYKLEKVKTIGYVLFAIQTYL